MSLETLRLNIKATLDAIDTPRTQIGFFLSYHPPPQYPKPDNVKITANRKFQSLSLSPFPSLICPWLESDFPPIILDDICTCIDPIFTHPLNLIALLFILHDQLSHFTVLVPSFWKHACVFLLLKWTHHK